MEKYLKIICNMYLYVYTYRIHISMLYLGNLLKFSFPYIELPILSTSKTKLKLSDPFFAWLSKPHEPFDKNNLEIMLQ